MRELDVRGRTVRFPGGDGRLRPGFRPLRAVQTAGLVVVVGRGGRIRTFDADTLAPRGAIRIRDAEDIRLEEGQIRVQAHGAVLHYDPTSLTARTQATSGGRLEALADRLRSPGRELRLQGGESEIPPDHHDLAVDLVDEVTSTLPTTAVARIALTANAFWLTVEIRHPSLDPATAEPCTDRARTRFAARVDARSGLVRVAIPLRGRVAGSGR